MQTHFPRLYAGFGRPIHQTNPASGGRLRGWLVLGLLLWLAGLPVRANVPGGGTNGPAVTLTDRGTTVAISNGLVSLVCIKSSAMITNLSYTFNNNGTARTINVLSNGYDGGKLYWYSGNFGSGTFAYSLVANNTNYCEIDLLSSSTSNGVMDVHFSMLRGAPGFYVTAILSHGTNDVAMDIGLAEDNIYAGSTYNWMSVDATRSRLMEVWGGLSVSVFNAPPEVYLWTNGIYAGQYEDKYKYSADFGVHRVHGWSSAGTGGYNAGLWNVSASSEYYNGGPMRRELMSHIGTTILNVLNCTHYGNGNEDVALTNSEVWAKVYGPYFIYCNNVPNALAGTNQAAQALYADAVAQAAAEQTAWPYNWFTNANYAPPTNRGVVTGRLVISDSGNPNASGAGLWVGLVQQPATSGSVYDFQEWVKPYQFWVKAEAGGNFTLPAVIAGTNYTLYAFGPGAPGTFQSQAQTDGNSPNTVDIPSTAFSVTITGGATNALGTVAWTPARVGATVFEIGYPDRTAAKFRHGEDYWVSDFGPSASTPSPVWSKHLEYPFDFPNEPRYTVGQSRWTTDWNYVQPINTDSSGNFNGSTSTLLFNLPAAPTNGAAAALYVALASDFQGPLEIAVNGTQIAGSSGYFPNYSSSSDESDTTIRQGIHGAFSDNWISFSSSLLQAGQNTLTINMRKGGYLANHAMYDYLRLDLAGYVPPAPASVSAWPGNSGNLVAWPLVPGATSYNLLRSTAAGSGYVPLTNGITGPVCGSGSNNLAYLDATAANGTTYYYKVQAINPNGSSSNSPASAGAAPLASLGTSAPAAPAGVSVAGTASHQVILGWNAVSGANFYSVWRSTLVDNGGGASNLLGTLILNNSTTNTTYTDTTPTDGSIYSYFVTATSAAGTSPNSATAVAVPRPAAPAAAPFSFTGSFASTNLTLAWSAVPGAIGYDLYRATNAAGPYALLVSITETTYTDYGLNTNYTYYYQIIAVNAGGVSSTVTNSVNGLQAAPASLAALGTNAQVTLSWSAAASAASYTILRGTRIGAETVTAASGWTGTTYTNTGLVNGTTYYYAVTATGTGGTSGKSPEASATPLAAGNGTWIANSGNWGDNGNWSGRAIAFGAGYTADFSTVNLGSNSTVMLDSSRTISGLKFGSGTARYNWTLAGTNTLTLGASPAINVLNQTSTISAGLAGAAGLAKTGAGTLVLGGAAETFTNGLAVNAGVVALDYSAANSPAASLVPATNALSLGGGTLQLTGASGTASTQAFNGLTLNAGASVVAAAPVAGTNPPVLNLGTLAENAGGTIEFIGPATINSSGAVAATAMITTTTAPGAAGVLGGLGLGKNGAFATVGWYDWATTNTAAPYTLVGGSQVSGFYQTTGITSGGNYDVNSGGVNTIGNAGGAVTLRFNQAAALTVNNSAFTYQNCQGILVTPKCGANNETISGASLEFIRNTSGGSSYGVIWQNNPAGYLNCAIVLAAGREAGQYNGLVQAGPGTVVYSGANTFELGAYLNGGCSVITAYNGFGLANNGYTTVAPVTLNGGTVVANATFTNDQAGANARPLVLGNNGGGLAATAGNTLTVDGLIGIAAGAGPLTIGIAAQTANGGVAGLLPGSGTGTANPAPVYATGTVVLTNANYYTGGTVLQSGTLNFNGLYALGGANFGGLTFNGGTLQYAAGFSGNNGPADLTALGTAGVTLAAGGGIIDVNGNSVAFAGSVGNGGTGALTVKSSLANGYLILQGSNSFSGALAITNVTLLANNTNGSATGSGGVTVQNDGVLAGTGAVGGSVTVAAGGTLSPGNPLGGLTLGGNLTLAAGSQTLLKLQIVPATNTAVNVAGTLTAGGTLVVTNLGAAALTNGASFQLFGAAAYAGRFTSLVLPSLTTNLLWNTNTLLVSGTLSVITLASPTLTACRLSGTNLVVSGTGGLSNWPYVILTTTNLAGAWTPVATNQFDSAGNFNWTNAAGLNAAPQFFMLKVQ